MATLTVLQSRRSTNGQEVTGVAAAGGGDVFPNTGKEIVIFKNGDASSKTVTFVTPATLDGLAVTDLAVTVAAGELRAIGPFPPGIYSVGAVAGGNLNITYSAVTSCTIAVLAVNPEA